MAVPSRDAGLVERERELQVVRDLDCDSAQGYLFGRPREAEGMVAGSRRVEAEPGVGGAGGSVG